MTPAPYTEDTLVQQTTAEYLEQLLGWRSVYAYNTEDFGPESLLGRNSDREVVLTRTLRAKLVELNPNLPDAAYDDAVRQLTASVASQTILSTNREQYGLIRDGVQVTFRDDKGERERRRLRVFDFSEPANVDYCGILKNLRKALATFAGTGDGGRGGQGGETDPTRPEAELLADWAEAIALVRAFLTERGASLENIITQTGFERNAAILAAKEAANENDETRKRFEVMCRAVFSKFKACLTVEGVNAYRPDYDAINVVYKSLQQDRDKEDITDIIRQLHQVVDQAIAVQPDQVAEPQVPYDISRIDFDRLRREFERSPAKRTTVQNLKAAIERRLQRLMEQNPLRTDFQRHYEQIVADYNREKDRVTIEKTFEALLRFMDRLSEEDRRAIREGFDEESLAIFDLLRKEELRPSDIKRIKAVAVELLAELKAEKLRVDHWRDKEATRDAVRIAIRDFLWRDETGLPVDAYDEAEVNDKADAVFMHVFRAYPTVPSPYYVAAS
ncbi:MAG: DUF3387 domain-containing protein [Desulfobacterales bacterium]|nr:MAG: DUF3387 domain-containing protein [Desulfobacterales bacterium]